MWAVYQIFVFLSWTGEALFNLLGSGHQAVHVDFTALDYVSSSYIGATGLMVMMAKEKDIVPNIIVNDKIARTFQLAGIDKIVNMRIVHGEKS